MLFFVDKFNMLNTLWTVDSIISFLDISNALIKKYLPATLSKQNKSVINTDLIIRQTVKLIKLVYSTTKLIDNIKSHSKYGMVILNPCNNNPGIIKTQLTFILS